MVRTIRSKETSIGPITFVEVKEYVPTKKDIAEVNRWWKNLNPKLKMVIMDGYQTALDAGREKK